MASRPLGSGLLVYGATGFTGGLIAEQARAAGLDLIVAGRDAAALPALGRALGCEHRHAPLHDQRALSRMLEGVGVVLHAAGPFGSTYRPLLETCLQQRVHYLDISGEIAAIEGVREHDAAARQAGVMLMPAVGFDVVPSDFLAARVARSMPSARALRIAVAGMTVVSRGSMKTLASRLGEGVLVRREGRLVSLAPGLSPRSFDFGRGRIPCLPLSWGDVATAYYTTGIRNIDVYCEATPIVRALMLFGRHLGQARALMPALGMGLSAPAARLWLDALPRGPSASERRAASTVIVAEAEGPRGERSYARVEMPDTYTTTALTAVSLARRVLAGDYQPGFQTPARVFGDDLRQLLSGMPRGDALRHRLDGAPSVTEWAA